MEYCRWQESEDGKELIVHAVVKDEQIFGSKLRLTRELKVSTEKNEFRICDVIENTGDREEGIEILYHMNMGYPLLDEDSVIDIPSSEVTPRDDHAAEDIANWNQIIRPEAGYVERCYYHWFPDRKGRAAIWQPKLGQGLEITFDAGELDGFVEWKMMGVRDYVLGLECGNCYPDGRDVMRRTGMLKQLAPGAKKEYCVTVRMLDFRKAIRSGVRKVNYYTYMAMAGGEEIASQFQMGCIPVEREGKRYKYCYSLIESDKDTPIMYHDIVQWGTKAMKENCKKAMKVFAMK